VRSGAGRGTRIGARGKQSREKNPEEPWGRAWDSLAGLVGHLRTQIFPYQRNPQTKGSSSFMDLGTRKKERGRAESRKMLNTESEWEKVSKIFPFLP